MTEFRENGCQSLENAQLLVTRGIELGAALLEPFRVPARKILVLVLAWLTGLPHTNLAWLMVNTACSLRSLDGVRLLLAAQPF